MFSSGMHFALYHLTSISLFSNSHTLFGRSRLSRGALATIQFSACCNECDFPSISRIFFLVDVKCYGAVLVDAMKTSKHACVVMRHYRAR